MNIDAYKSIPHLTLANMLERCVETYHQVDLRERTYEFCNNSTVPQNKYAEYLLKRRKIKTGNC